MECPHKKWRIDSHNVGTCLECGEERQFPWDGKAKVVVLKAGSPASNSLEEKEVIMRPHPNIKGRHRFYEDNKDAIIADLLSIGKAATRENWNIPKGTLGKLMSRWLTKEQKAAIPTERQPTQETTPPPTNSTPSNGQLPPLPQFSNAWEPEVQLQWFEVYETLATRKG